jgi:hypothetical protein
VLTKQVGDVVASITEQMSDSQREIDSEKSTLRSYLSERFASDDQILSRLPGLVAQIVTDPEVSEDEKSIEQWCKAIVSFRTAEIKARVDTVYLTNISSNSHDGVPDEPEEDLKERKVALQAELEELHSEIASVAEMIVEHDIRKPMTDMRERKDRDRTQARTAWLTYVSIYKSHTGIFLTVTGSLDTRLHGQTPQHNHYQRAEQRRVPTSIRANPSSSYKAYARDTSTSRNTIITTHDFRHLSLHTHAKTQAHQDPRPACNTARRSPPRRHIFRPRRHRKSPRFLDTSPTRAS